MLIPSKYEDIFSNPLIIGSHILKKINSSNYLLDDLYEELTQTFDINLDQYFNTITFLWLSELIEIDKQIISLVKNDSSKIINNT